MNKLLLTFGALLLLALGLYGAERLAGDYAVRLLTQAAIFVTLAVSYNLVDKILERKPNGQSGKK